MAPSSFGLSPDNPTHGKKYILEEIFILRRYCHFTWDEAWNLPVEYRKWFIARERTEREKIAEEVKKKRQRSQGRQPPG